MTPDAPALFVGYANLDLIASVPALPGDGDRVTARRIDSAFGGMAANAACAAARAGAPAVFFGAVGDDPFGRLVVADLEARGVDTRHVVRDAPATSKALILVGPGGERAIVSEPVGYDGAALRRFLQHHDGPPGVLYVDGYHLVAAHAELALARAHGFRVYCDLDGAPDASSAEEVWARVGVADVAQWNPKVARALTRFAAPGSRAEPGGASVGGASGGDTPGTARLDLEAADARLAAAVPVVLRTAGDRPVVVRAQGERSVVPVEAVADVRDTTGAGDTFAGTMVAALLRGTPLLAAVAQAIAASRALLRVTGARAPLP